MKVTGHGLRGTGMPGSGNWRCECGNWEAPTPKVGGWGNTTMKARMAQLNMAHGKHVKAAVKKAQGAAAAAAAVIATPRIDVVITANDGSTRAFGASSQLEVEDIARRHMHAGNHMICVDIDRVRAQRWDRIPFVDVNVWHEVSVDEMEVLGPIRAVRAVNFQPPAVPASEQYRVNSIERVLSSAGAPLDSAGVASRSGLVTLLEAEMILQTLVSAGRVTIVDASTGEPAQRQYRMTSSAH